MPSSAPTSVVLFIILYNVATALAFATPPVNIANHRHASPKARAHQLQLRPLLSRSSNNDTEPLLEKARRLRQEVSAIESSKVEIQRERDARERIRQVAELEMKEQKDNLRMRYSAEIPILKDMGKEVMERVDFPPRIKGGKCAYLDTIEISHFRFVIRCGMLISAFFHCRCRGCSRQGKSHIVAVQAPLPLGLVLGEEASRPGITSVDDVDPNGNGASAGVKQGDIVRAITACQTTMETPTWQLLAGGIGQPKTKRFMYSVDGRPLEEVLNAVGSNRMDVQGRDVWLVLERMI